MSCELCCSDVELDEGKNIWLCKDCKKCISCKGEYYMVTDEVWRQAQSDLSGMLCLNCLENRIGRSLTFEDFPDYPINRGAFTNMSRKFKKLVNLR